MIRLLYNLLFKNFLGIWNKYYNKMFEKSKKFIIIKLIIIYSNLEKKAFIKYNFNKIIIKNILL